MFKLQPPQKLLTTITKRPLTSPCLFPDVLNRDLIHLQSKRAAPTFNVGDKSSRFSDVKLPIRWIWSSSWGSLTRRRRIYSLTNSLTGAVNWQSVWVTLLFYSSSFPSLPSWRPVFYSNPPKDAATGSHRLNSKQRRLYFCVTVSSDVESNGFNQLVPPPDLKRVFGILQLPGGLVK